MSRNEHDQREIRCRMLGHEVKFGYCREGMRELPCHKIFDCWFEHFDVEQYIREHYTEEEIRRILAPPQPKMVSLFELIQKAQKHTQGKEGDAKT